MFIKYETEVSSRVSGGERGVVDFGKLFTETNEEKFRNMCVCVSVCLLSVFLCTATILANLYQIRALCQTMCICVLTVYSPIVCTTCEILFYFVV